LASLSSFSKVFTEGEVGGGERKREGERERERKEGAL
jgi:hypothetical protein